MSAPPGGPQPPVPATPDWAGLIAELARMPGVAQRLADQHRSDEHRRCRGCTRSGVATSRWPCTLALLALAAGADPGR